MAKRKRKKRSIFKNLILIVVFFLFVSVISDMSGFFQEEKTVEIEISEGATLYEIATQLKENNIIKFPFIFRMYSKITGSTDDLKFGIHTVDKNMSYKEILKSLSVSAGVKGITLVIPEGYELRQIAEKCEQSGLCSEKDFLDECENGNFDYDFLDGNSLEGYLFPASYSFTESPSAYEIIDTMLSKFDSVYNDEYKRRAKELGFSTKEVITLASMIEREGANNEEFKKVSAVFHNRLKKNMKLESCATVQYILKTRKTVLSVSDTKIKSPYNTYLYAGLPKGPIASPGEAAIKAALYPDNNNYLYFLSNNGKTVFSRTFDEHQKAMREAGL